MFPLTPLSESQRIKAIIFLLKSTQQLKEQYIAEEKFELAAETQQQVAELKQSLFEILLSDRYQVDQRDDLSLVITMVK